MFRNFFSPRRVSTPARRPRRFYRPLLEELENRVAPAGPYDVTDTPGGLTLYSAIQLVNNDTSATPDNPARITFHIPSTADDPGPVHIYSFALNNFPTITRPVIIDATTQPGYTRTRPTFVLEFTDSFNIGLDIAASNCTVKGMVITKTASQFGFVGIQVTGDSCDIEDNIIGTDPTGNFSIRQTEPPYADSGIDIYSSYNTVRGNVVSACSYFGIGVTLGTRNVIEENFIGTKVNGTDTLANGTGLWIASSGNNTIGPGNVIFGNRKANVLIDGSSTGNVVQGNHIGTDVSGFAHAITPDETNVVGVLIDGASANTIGGLTSDERNVISGNLTGVQIQGGGSGNVIEGNYIGTDATGRGALGNKEGVLISDSPGNTVGGEITVDKDPENLISGNLDNGVWIRGRQATENKVQFNRIGADVFDNPLGNGNDGVFIDGAPGNLIGGAGTRPLAIAGNTIVANGSRGIRIAGQQAANNRVTDNFVGTDVVSDRDLGNTHDGIAIVDAPDNLVLRNTISGNQDNGVLLFGAAATGNFLEGNQIGLGDPVTFGSGIPARLGNQGDGLLITHGASKNYVTSGNTISGNKDNGVEISSADSNTVAGNFIGTNFDGTFSDPDGVPNSGDELGNSGAGVMIDKASLNRIGLGPSNQNVISGNTWGVYIRPGSSLNQVNGNNIGTTKVGEGKIPNALSGVVIDGAGNNFIGPVNVEDVGTLISNLISGNGENGIEIINGASQNKVRANLIGTDLLGIDPLGNGNAGVLILHSSGNFIGTPEQSYSNVISGNLFGIDIARGSANNRVMNNIVGANLASTARLGQQFSGVRISQSSDNIIGTDGDGNLDDQEGNFIAGNVSVGLAIFTTDDAPDPSSTVRNRVFGNDIGTPTVGNGQGVSVYRADSDEIGGPGIKGNRIRGNVHAGVSLLKASNNFVSGNFIALNHEDGVTVLAGCNENIIGLVNTIQYNDRFGVNVEFSGTRTLITGNTIFANFGGNLRLPTIIVNNFIATTASFTGSVHVEGTLHGVPDTAYDVDFFASSDTGADGAGAAELFLGARTITTSDGGDISFRADFSDHVPVGWFVTTTLTGPDGGTSAFSPPVTVTSAPPPNEVSVSDVTLTAADSGTTAFVFTATLRNITGVPVTVQVDTADGTAAVADGDYQPLYGLLLTFTPGGPLTQTVTVLVNAEAAHDADETFTLNLTNVSGATIGKAGAGTILDHHPLAVSINDVALPEGDAGTTAFAFTVSLSGPTAEPVSVQVDTADGTATAAGGDYQPVSGLVLTFTPGGPTTQTVTVLVNGNTTVEADETFTVNLSNVTGTNVTLARPTGLGTIQNDDATAFSIDDVTGLQGDSGTTVFTFTVSQSNASDFPESVRVDTADGTANVADGDYNPVHGLVLTFNPGAPLTQTVTVFVNGDTTVEADETFTVNLSQATGTDVSIARAAGVGTIQNDNAGAFSINDVTLAPGPGGTTAFVFTVSLSNPSDTPESVQVDTSDGTATVAEGDYQPIQDLVLTFNPGGPLTQSGTVVVNADPTFEPTETFSVNLSHATGLRVDLARAVGVGTILNPFVVITTADGGPGSLRDAILAANANPGPDVITFNIPGTGVQTISVGFPLPTVTDPVIIDGYTQPGASPNTLAQGDNAVLLIDLAAQSVSSAGVLTISAGNSTVRGLVINRTGFGATAIVLTGNGGNHVEGNFLGTDAAGAVGLGVGSSGPFTVVPDSRADARFDPLFSANGISIIGSTGNIIGGTTPAARNLISANGQDGVRIASDGNVVQGNYIGTDRTGTEDLGNFASGAEIVGGTGNLIGGTLPGAGNLIGGNSNGANVAVENGGAGNVVQGNLIGTDVTGVRALDTRTNSQVIGVEIQGPGNTIGGTAPGAGNLISGSHSPSTFLNQNIGSGVWLGFGASGNVVQGNLIGTDATAAFAVSNFSDGIRLEAGASNNLIGGLSPAARNVISGNLDYGVDLVTPTGLPAPTGNLVQGNFIGTDGTGTRALGNRFGGMNINAPANTVGGTTPGAGNVISGNAGPGVRIAGSGTTNNLVQGNYVGTDVTGTAPLGNLSSGVVVSASVGGVVGSGASANLIGGASSVDPATGKLTGAGNVIAANRNAGVILQTSGNLVQGNFIGTDVFGTAALANNTSNDTLGAGVSLQTGGSANTVGGASTRDASGRLAGLGNLISGNVRDGVLLNSFSRTPDANNVIQGNWIGTDVTGTRPLGNTGDGVDFGGNARNNTLGGPGPGLGNLISANGTGGLAGGQQAGVQFHIPADTDAPGNNTVLGNRIGTDVTGTQPLGNRGDGVLLSDSAGNTIGGAAGNVIAFNAGRGVAVTGNTSTGDPILGNSLFSNGGLGIDLGGDGVTLNDAKGHTGPNHFQNFPVLFSAVSDSGGTTIAGNLNSTPNGTFRLEFFASPVPDASGFGEGTTYLGATQVVTDGSWSASFTFAVPAVLPGGFVTATATALVGSSTPLVPADTSEFSAAFPVTALTDVDVSQTVDRGSINAGDTAGFTITITNEGPGDAMGLTLSDQLPAGAGNDITWQIDPSSTNAVAFQVTGTLGSQLLTLKPGVATLASGQTLTVRLSGITSGNDTDATTFQGMLTNTATVNATNEVGAEHNDQATATLTINAPDVDVSQTADRSSINAGDTAGFAITITNEGAGDAAGLALSDPLPPGIGNDIEWQIDGTSANAGSFQITGAVGSQLLELLPGVTVLGHGQSLTVHVVGDTGGNDASAATFQGTLTNVVTVNAGNERAAEQNEPASATITIAAPDVDVSQTADRSSINAGDTAGFTITLRNDGPGDATGVTLSDALPPGLGNDISWQIDSGSPSAASFQITGAVGSQVLTLQPDMTALGHGQSLTVHIVGMTSGNDTSVGSFHGTLTNVVTVNAGNEPTAEQSPQAATTVAILAPDVDVSQVVDSASITAGATAGFTITVTNEGIGTATGVTLFDALWAGPAADMSWAIDPGTGTPGTFTLTGPVGNQVLSLAPGANTLAADVSLSVHVTARTTTNEEGTVNNTAFADAGNEPDPERNDRASATIGVNPLGVVMTLTADRSPINAGDAAGFTVAFTNDSPIDFAALSDPLPGGLDNDINWQIDSTLANADAFQITGPVGSQVLTLAAVPVALAAGQTLTVHITGVTSARDTSPATFQGTLTNAATVNSGSRLDRVQTAQAGILILAPDVDVTLTVDKATVNASETAGFTVTVLNEGQGPAAGITLTALLPGGLGHDVNWQIDGSAGTPSAFQITGAVGSQVLSLVRANVTLAAGARLSVHVTGVTSTADADPTTLTGTLPITATVNAGNELAAEQNNQAGVAIAVAGQSHNPLGKGQTATIGFWHNKNGQAVIANFNGGSTATALGNWLATDFGNLFGGLAGKTNAQVASAYQTAFANAGGVQGNTYVQSFALALAVYTTTYSLGGASTAANPATAKFGFQITAAGAGAATFNVGTSGAALGVPNGTTLTVLQILQLADHNYSRSTGLFYRGDSKLTSALDKLLNNINQAGDIPS